MKKYGITKFYDADPKEKTGGDQTKAATQEDVMKEFKNIQAALEKNFEKKSADQEKNWQEKLDAAKASIVELETKMKANEATVEVLEKLKSDLYITVKALDVVQSRQKADSMTNRNNGGQKEDYTLRGQISKAFDGFAENIKSGKIAKGDNEFKMTYKAVGDMTVIGNVSTGVVPNTYRSGIVPSPSEMVHLRNLVNVTPSGTDSYHFYRHTVGEGSITWQGNENGQKAQIDEDLNEQTVNLDYLAGFLRISRKMLRNFTGLQAYISRWLPEKYYQAEDTKGYQYLIANATGVANTDTGGGMIRQIIRTIGLQKKAKYNVTGIVVDGAVWANILTYTTSAGEFTQPIGAVTISPSGQVMICGIPLYTASWVGGDEAIIGDWNFYEIIQSEALSLQFFEQDGTNGRDNKITARIEASVGFALLDPKAFAVASLESVS